MLTFSGQAVHFRHNAPEAVPYATHRYLYEANRHWGIVNTQLRKHRYLLRFVSYRDETGVRLGY